MELLDAESRARLPPLYSNEELGLNAFALVKFTTPLSDWIWYASEGSPVDEDGFMDTDKPKVDFLFFGLVIGFEIELGYFSAAELIGESSAIRLLIERDMSYQPKTLAELQSQHRAERGGM